MFMLKNKELADYIMDRLSDLGDIRNISMKGGQILSGIYGNGFMVKITEVSKKYMHIVNGNYHMKVHNLC